MRIETEIHMFVMTEHIMCIERHKHAHIESNIAIQEYIHMDQFNSKHATI